MSSKPVFTEEQVAAHNTENDNWIIIGNKVYDVTKFGALHPGGHGVLTRHAGKDCTIEFFSMHKAYLLDKYERLVVGTVEKKAPKKTAKGKATMTNKDDPGFGSLIPFAEPYWYKDNMSSPYYNDSHRAFRAKVRSFVDKEIIPFCHEWDEAGTYPPELHEKAYQAGIYGAIWPKEYGGTPPENFDYFHELIYFDEMSRCAAGGILWAVFFSFGIALPPILNTGSQYLKDKVARDVITGKAIMSLAVTEPYAGSDVASVRTTAVKSPCGKFYTVTGEKKFITSGVKAQYLTVAARTGGPGIKGISLFLLEKGMPGLTTRRQKTQGWWTSNTAYVVMDKVKVPAENLIGVENDGFLAIMHNFNHERFMIAAMSNRYARVCLEDSIKYARLRETFGTRLVEHQVIRHKIAEMARGIETTHTYLEMIAHWCNQGKLKEIGGQIALCKVQSTKVMEFCAREASQIMGGNSYLRGGIGEKVERLYREVRVNAIGGGSEEIMLNLVATQAKL